MHRCFFQNRIHHLLRLALLALLPQCLQSQSLTVTGGSTPPFTTDNLISNVFLGEGVEVTSVVFKGKASAVGYFTGGGPNIGIPRGIVLTTGRANGADGLGNTQESTSNASTATDPDLNAIATAGLNDVAVYIIKFIPTADTLRFRYCFASEEYPEFACQVFNDVFGFFIQGPGFPTPTNIAKVPSTTQAVSINNIHPANGAGCPAKNVQYYNDNNGSNKQPVYDGFTDVFTAQAIVTPCQEYTIKLAIADVGDDMFDSGVFLEAKSFGTGSLKVELATLSADATIAEDCAPGSLTFSLPKATDKDFSIDFKLGGTATQGVDYQNFPSKIVIPAGQTSTTIPISVLADNIPETGEFIALDVQRDPCNRDTILIYLRDNIIVSPKLPADTSYCLGTATPLVLDGALPLPTPAPPSFTNANNFPIPDDDDNGLSSSIQVFGVQPTILGPGVIRSVCVNVTHTWIDDVDLYLVSPGGQVLELSTDNGKNGDNYTNTCFTPTATTPISFPGPAAPASAAPFTGDWLPEGPWSDLWDGANPTNGTWKLQVSDDQTNLLGTLLNWTITFEPSYQLKYAWSPSTGLDCTTCPKVQAMPVQPTTYTLVVTDSYGCSVQDEITVKPETELPPPSVNCTGETANSITFGWTAVAGAASYEVNINGAGWVPANGTLAHTATPVAPGTVLNVLVRGVHPNSECGALAGSATCAKCATPSLKTDPVNPVCTGSTTGSVTVTVTTNNNPPYTFSLDNQTNGIGIFQGLLAGVYTVTATDLSGCSASQTFTLTDPPALQGTVSTKDASCFAGSNGSATALPNGGATPYSFQWSNGGATAEITGLPAGPYTVTTTDAKGCTAVLGGTVNQPPGMVASANSYVVRCFGEKTGALKLNIQNGTPAYSIAWSGPNAYAGLGDSISSLEAGTYRATVTDAAGCTLVYVTDVAQPANGLTLSLPAFADTICFLANNGTATVFSTGGNTPYTYLWDAAGQTTQTATGLSSAPYRVTVTDAKGCTQTAETFILQKQELSVWASVQDPRCYNGSDGSAKVTIAFYGADAADLGSFQYKWSTSPPQNTLSAGQLRFNSTYTVTITDALGCTAARSVTTGNPYPLLVAAKTLQGAPCFGEPGGTATAAGSGGTAPYAYEWSGGGGNDSLATDLKSGTYRVTVTDAAGCAVTATATIAEPTALKISFLPAEVKCFGGNSGSIKTTASGGTPPYNYLWVNNSGGNPQATEISNLYAGVYALTLTDAKGCRLQDSVKVGQPAAALGGTAIPRDATCFGFRNGEIKLAGTGGTPPYRYALDADAFNGSSLQIGLGAGVYTPKVQDRNGCTIALPPVTVAQNPPVLVDLGPDIAIDLGESASLLATVSNGHPPLRYAWPKADSVWLSCLDCPDPFVDSLLFSRYFTIWVSDSLGCAGTDQVSITVKKTRQVFVPTGFSPNGDGNNDRLCPLGHEGVKVIGFQVFDRWGERVFENGGFTLNDPAQGWDGTFRGEAAAAGAYVWLLEVAFADGARETFKGGTVLIR